VNEDTSQNGDGGGETKAETCGDGEEGNNDAGGGGGGGADGVMEKSAAGEDGVKKLLDDRLVGGKDDEQVSGAAGGVIAPADEGRWGGWISSLVEKAEGTLSSGLESFDRVVDDAVARLESTADDDENDVGAVGDQDSSSATQQADRGVKKEGKESDIVHNMIEVVQADIGKAKGFVSNAWNATVEALREIEDDVDEDDENEKGKPAAARGEGKTKTGDREIIPAGAGEQSASKTTGDLIASEARELLHEAQIEGKRLGETLGMFGRSAMAMLASNTYVESEEESDEEESQLDTKMAMEKARREAEQEDAADAAGSPEALFAARFQEYGGKDSMVELEKLSNSSLREVARLSGVSGITEEQQAKLTSLKNEVETLFGSAVESTAAAAEDAAKADSRCKDILAFGQLQCGALEKLDPNIETEKLKDSEVCTAEMAKVVELMCEGTADLTAQAVLAVLSGAKLGDSELSEARWQARAALLRNVQCVAQNAGEEMSNAAVAKVEELGQDADGVDDTIGAITDEIYAHVNAGSAKLEQAIGLAVPVVRLQAVKSLELGSS